MNTGIVVLLIFLAALVLSWLLTRRIIVRWKRRMEPTEKLLLGVCVFAALFFVVAGVSIGAAYVYRQFTHQLGSAISETVDAFEEGRERASETEETVAERPETRISEQRKLAILDLGGKVDVDEQNPHTPIVGVDLSNTEVTDANLAHLEALASLTTLDLSNTDITDAGLHYLKGLTHLRVLDISWTKITDEGLQHVKVLTELEQLILPHDRVAVDAVSELKDALPKCDIITRKPGVDYPEGTTLTGKVIAIGCGDAFSLERDDRSAVPVRLAGIDAPQRGQGYWKPARDALRSLLMFALPMITRRKPDPSVPGFRWKPSVHWLCKAQ